MADARYRNLLPALAPTSRNNNSISLTNVISQIKVKESNKPEMNRVAPMVMDDSPINTSMIPLASIPIICMTSDDMSIHYYDVLTDLINYAIRCEDTMPDTYIWSIVLNTYLIHFPSLIESLKLAFENNTDFELTEVSLLDWNAYMDNIDSHRRTAEGVDFKTASDENRNAYAFLGLIILLMGKQIIKDSHVNWTSKRLRGVVSANGGVFDTLKNDICPSYYFSQKAYLLQSAYKRVRALIFNKVLEAAKKPSRLQVTCRIVANLLKGCEMTNFFLVYRHLIKNHSYLFSIHEFDVLKVDLLSALKAYESSGEHRDYVKLLGDSEDMAVFNNDSIKALSKVAKALAIDDGVLTLNQFVTGANSTEHDYLIRIGRETRALYRSAETRDATDYHKRHYTANVNNERVLESVFRHKAEHIIDADQVVNRVGAGIDQVIDIV